MCDVGLDSPRFWLETPRRARKGHTCYECCHPIVKGREYIEVEACYEDGPTRFRMHADCLALAAEIRRDHCGGESAVGELKAGIREHYEDDPSLLGEWAALLRRRRAEQEGREPLPFVRRPSRRAPPFRSGSTLYHFEVQ